MLPITSKFDLAKNNLGVRYTLLRKKALVMRISKFKLMSGNSTRGTTKPGGVKLDVSFPM